jgi:hypothetical protein
MVRCGPPSRLHWYFGRKLLIFISLRVELRRKIFKTKEFFAKYSRIRSYERFPLLWTLPDEKRPGSLEKDSGIHSAASHEIICKAGIGIRETRVRVRGLPHLKFEM